MNTNENQTTPMYELYLECYCHPRWASGAKPYWGSMGDITLFIKELTRTKAEYHYQDLIDAYLKFEENGAATYTMVGREYPFAVPVEEVCRKDHDYCGEIIWPHFSYSESFWLFRATSIYCTETLVKTEDNYIRCVKLSFENLQLNLPPLGWVEVNDKFRGFPGAISWDGICAHNMNLFIAIERYELNEFKQAMRDFRSTDIEKLNLPIVMHDVIGDL